MTELQKIKPCLLILQGSRCSKRVSLNRTAFLKIACCSKATVSLRSCHPWYPFFVSSASQNGTGGEDFLVGAAAVDEHGGNLFLGGSTTGGWGNRQVGEGYDFAGVQLDLANSNEIRRWQVSRLSCLVTGKKR